MIEKAGNPTVWPTFFTRRKPLTFWYIYPNKNTVLTEFKGKWLEFLPGDEYKDHETYGWRMDSKNGYPFSITFNSGVVIYFKTHGVDLQSGTVDYVGCDEELPSELFPELYMRLSATDGIFAHVFTPVQSQQFWYEAMEEKGRKERFKEAWKRSVSLYDCMLYADGSLSPWTKERIDERVQTCSDEYEILIRIHGRFVRSRKGLKYGTFSRESNLKQYTAVPYDWLWFVGVDIGGGGKGHPAAISFIAVRPDYKKGRVVRCWRGNREETTTSGDILNQYIKMRNDLGNPDITGQFYDWQAKDFFLVSEREGYYFEPAEKGHEIGESIFNTLFKNNMLDIDDTEENRDLVEELTSLLRETSKQKAKDDAIDSVRYGITKIPWDLSDVTTDLQPRPELETRTPDKPRPTRHRDQITVEEIWMEEDDIEFYNEIFEEL